MSTADYADLTSQLLISRVGSAEYIEYTTLGAQAMHDDQPNSYTVGAVAQPALPDYYVRWEDTYRDEQAQHEAERTLLERMSVTRRNAILVVDDERSIADLLAELLEDAGYEVFIASNGRAALAIARREHPALVLTDLMMPGVDGKEFLARLRSSPITHDIPVVVMSSIRPNMETLYNVPFLPKPFDLDDVLDLVQTYAGESPSQSSWVGSH